jgi:arylsulfatase A-like enzyme
MSTDGSSLLGSTDRKRLLVEHWGDFETTIPDWASLRSKTYQYIEYYRENRAVRFRELYDLKRDPYELRNLVGTVSPARLDALHSKLATDRECVGTTCP